MNAITMTAYRRPKYTKSVLEALMKCRGVEQFVFFPQIEPENEEVMRLWDNWTLCECRPEINGIRKGLNRNTHAALTRAIESGATIIIHLEDDTVPCVDALEYFQWAIQEVLPLDDKMMSACGYNHPMYEPELPYGVSVRKIFNCWGWATNKSRLAWMLARWSFEHPTKFTRVFRAKYSRVMRECFPHLSRIQNIGYEMGENMGGRFNKEHYLREHRTPWVAKGNLPSGSFHMI